MKKRGALSTSVKNSIKRSIDHGFKDWQGYQLFIAAKVDEILDESQKFGIDTFLLKLSLKRYLKTPAPPVTKEEKQHLEEARIALTSIYVMILYNHEEAKSQRWHSIDHLLREYPQFQGQSQDELQLLLQYRNIVFATLLLIPAARNKKTIMAIAGRLQGRPKEYVTGGGQKEETRIRVDIYEKEGGVHAQRRPDRQIQTNVPNCDSSVSSLSTPPYNEEDSFFTEMNLYLSSHEESVRSDASTVQIMEPLGECTGFGLSSNSAQSDCSDNDMCIELEFKEFLDSISDDDTDLVEWKDNDLVPMITSSASTYADDEFNKVAAATGDESLAFSNRNSLRLHLETAVPQTVNDDTSSRNDQYLFMPRSQYNNGPFSNSGNVASAVVVESVLGRRDRGAIAPPLQLEPVPKSLRLAVDPGMFDDDIPDFTPRFRDLLINSTS